MQKDNLTDSIANVRQLREACFYVGLPFVQADSMIVDLGSADGDAIVPFVDASPEDVYFQCIDRSQDALHGCIERFNDHSRLEFMIADLSKEYPAFSASLTLAVCTLQHLPPKDRFNVLRSAWTTTRPGGALILVEEIDAPLEDLNQLYIAQNYEKIRNYKPDLGIQKFTTTRYERMLRRAGFHYVDCFYRSFGVAGWIAVKDFDNAH